MVCNITSALLDGVIKHVWSYSPLAMEALAILETLQLTLARGSQSPNCSMDAKVFFLVLTEPDFSPLSDIVVIIATIAALHSQLSHLSFELMYQWSNRVIDIVAKLCLKNILPCD